MSRTAREVANILKEIYDESFGDDENEKYRLDWADLRGIAGVGKLEETFVSSISEKMAEADFALITLGNFLLVGCESDFAYARRLPARMLERYLPDDDDAEDGFVEDEELEED